MSLILPPEIARRRTFAIIAHPDAGKTTLTEKLLLFGGAIQAAGAVKAKGEARRAKSDWMKVERERGDLGYRFGHDFRLWRLHFQSAGYAGPRRFQRG